MVLGIGLMVRLVFLLTSAKYPEDALFVADPYAYLQMADHAYHGRYFVSFRGFPTSYLSVGYPALVAIARHLVFGLVSTWGVALVLNVLSFVATALAMEHLVTIYGRRLPGGQQASNAAVLCAVAVLAVHPDFVFATGLVMTELVAVALLAWGLVLSERALDGQRSSGSRALCAASGGLLLGLTVFVRPSMLLLVVPVAGILLYRRSWRPAILFLVCSIAPLIPLAVNNSRVGAGPGITSAMWMNVCDGLVNRHGEFEWRRECRVTTMPGESVDARTEARNTEWARKISVLYLRHHWMVWVSRTPLRVWHSLWTGGWATQFSVHWAQNYVWTRQLRLFFSLSQVFSGLIAGLGIIQIGLMALRRRMVWWPVVVLLAGSYAGVLVSFGQSRFGWPVAILLFVPFASLSAGRKFAGAVGPRHSVS